MLVRQLGIAVIESVQRVDAFLSSGRYGGRCGDRTCFSTPSGVIQFEPPTMSSPNQRPDAWRCPP